MVPKVIKYEEFLVKVIKMYWNEIIIGLFIKSSS